MAELRDKFNRTIDYMRISITDRCNLRCIYCMPSDGLRLIEHKEILSYEEILRIIRIASGLGVRKIRITGGEPLARKRHYEPDFLNKKYPRHRRPQHYNKRRLA